MAHSHPIVDDGRRFTIDPISRAISYDGDAIILIQGDHNSELFSFEIPRFVEGHDMSLCDQIKIHFNNIDRRKENESKDVYPVKNAVVSDDMVVFDWLVSGNATKYYGTLSFLIQFCCLEDDGTYSYICIQIFSPESPSPVATITVKQLRKTSPTFWKSGVVRLSVRSN